MSKQPSKYRGIEWVKEGILPYPRHGSCVHYEPAIICGKGKKAVCSQQARSYIVRNGAGNGKSWHCEACGMSIKEKDRGKIEKIVEYLNLGGDDDKKLSSLFRGVEIGEVMQSFPKEMLLKCSALCSEEFVPPKNIQQ